MSLPANPPAGAGRQPRRHNRAQGHHRRQPENVLRLPAHAGLLPRSSHHRARAPGRARRRHRTVRPAHRCRHCPKPPASSGLPGSATGAQDIFWEDEGAYTGEVGGKTVAELGGRYAEVGHAERRRIFGEDDRIIGLKTAAAYRNGLTPVLCVGELQPGSVEEASASAPRTSMPP